MKKTVIYSIWVVAIIMLAVGFFMGLAGWSQTITKSYRASDFMPMAIGGTLMFVYSFFMMGLAYIVEAACLYIEAHKNNNSRK